MKFVKWTKKDWNCYNRYLQTPEWQQKRALRIALDGGRCRVCNQKDVSEGGDYYLQAHHRTYENLYHESVEDDLTTLCERCHEFATNVMRGDRNKDKKLPSVVYEPAVYKKRKDIRHGLENVTLQVDLGSSASHAQRTNRRPPKQVVKIDQTDFVKTQQSRRRLRGNGTT